jgi:hypothetical protein
MLPYDQNNKVLVHFVFFFEILDFGSKCAWSPLCIFHENDDFTFSVISLERKQLRIPGWAHSTQNFKLNTRGYYCYVYQSPVGPGSRKMLKNQILNYGLSIPKNPKPRRLGCLYFFHDTLWVTYNPWNNRVTPASFSIFLNALNFFKNSNFAPFLI